MLNVDEAKIMVWQLASELNSELGLNCIQPHQQEKTKRNISLTNGAGERIYFTPLSDGYRISLEHKSLVLRMLPFMMSITGRSNDGFTQSDRYPCWKRCDYSQVREAAYFFADPDNNSSVSFDVFSMKKNDDISVTERNALIKARIGQGTFRNGVLNMWDGACAVTGVTLKSVLIASHIKPWAISSNHERLDPSNGLLLSATLDRLFDQYLISFNPDNGEMFISNDINDCDRIAMGIPANLRKTLTNKQADYLKYHFEISKLSK